MEERGREVMSAYSSIGRWGCVCWNEHISLQIKQVVKGEGGIGCIVRCHSDSIICFMESRGICTLQSAKNLSMSDPVSIYAYYFTTHLSFVGTPFKRDREEC